MNIVMSIIESLAYQDLVVLGHQAKPSYCITYNAPEEYIILLHIKMQFKILIASYSYKSQKLK